MAGTPLSPHLKGPTNAQGRAVQLTGSGEIGELRGEIGELRGETAGLSSRLDAQLSKLIAANVTTLAAATALFASLVR